MVYITEIHMSSGGSKHEHIEKMRWLNPDNVKTGESTRSAMSKVGVVRTSPPYLRTHADGRPSDNLPWLPRY
ncbi:DUF3892 domain-containing protein [Archangium sp.]|uniref:DUF3892 domain-containing protein n=1 Tax=Archangium sp. TaxID=1872627 RepID=UPI003899F637